MCLLEEDFRTLLSSPLFARRICAFVIDEAHCIEAWGLSKFREMYARLGTLRAFVGENIPFLITSATLPPSTLTFIHQVVHLEPSKTFYINLGNDRQNITWNVRNMDGGRSNVEALEFLLPKEQSGDLEHGLVFFDSIEDAMNAHRWLTSKLPPEKASRVGIYHSRRGDMSKDFVYEEFCKGNLDILFCTEAAGMVCPIYRARYGTILIVHENRDATFPISCLSCSSLCRNLFRSGFSELGGWRGR